MPELNKITLYYNVEEIKKMLPDYNIKKFDEKAFKVDLINALQQAMPYEIQAILEFMEEE